MTTSRPKDELSTIATLAEQSDEQLLLSYRESEDSAVFTELVARYERELYNYLRRYLGDAAQAEDVFQATFLQVHVKRGSFEAGRRFRPWLYTIATNQAIDSQRRTKRHRRMSLEQAMQPGDQGATLRDFVEGGEFDPAHVAEHGEQAEWVRGAVDALPEPLRRAVNLVYFRGMKYGDAAKVMSVPVGTVKSRMHAALQRLGQAWQDAQPAARL
ncbi:MAG: RNA polymerase sigma factor [Pirellulales bacterium]|nr:RNA polymerase sigma factor [Pirellulales bacterium]MBX3431758.1 RNA polymerase sigma factor [Pirellulales bacterium]